MLIKIYFYLSALVSILFLPDWIWEKIWVFFQLKIHNLKKLYSAFFAKKETTKGDQLLEFFPILETRMNQGIKSTSIDLPKYKFYTSLLIELLDAHRNRGISLKSIIPELRGNLIKDLQFEKKISGNITGGNLQFAVITFTTWSFIILSSNLAELPLRFRDLFIILSAQTLGVLFFNLLLKRIKFLTFKKFDQAIERLYLFVTLTEIGLPVSQTLSESKVLEGDLMSHKLFSPCASRLSGLINRWTLSGISPKQETAEIIRELWHIKESSFERFLKHLDQLKFCVLAMFFLPAYFFYLYSIFQFFMEQ